MLRVEHTLPEARAGATLDESSARTRAAAVLKGEFGLDVAGGQAREVSARPAKLQGADRLDVHLRGHVAAAAAAGRAAHRRRARGRRRSASVRRFVFVPEEWERGSSAPPRRAASIVRIIIGIVFGGLLVSAAVVGVVAWSRRKYTPRLFFAAAGIMLVVTLASAINAWPATQAIMPTEIPLAIQILGAIGVGLVALVITSSLAGLALGAQPARLDRLGHARRPRRAAARRRRRRVRRGTPRRWQARCGRPSGPKPSTSPRSDRSLPALAVALDPLAGFLTRAAVLLSLLVSVQPRHARVDAAPHARWRRRGARRVSRARERPPDRSSPVGSPPGSCSRPACSPRTRRSCARI